MEVVRESGVAPVEGTISTGVGVGEALDVGEVDVDFKIFQSRGWFQWIK